MSHKCTLILGGARSGKSSFAQNLASQAGNKVLFVATGSHLDEEMRRRIEMHKKKRPKGWQTIEVLTDTGEEIERKLGNVDVVIIDCITLLINNIFEKCKANGSDDKTLEKEAVLEIKKLIKCISKLNACFIMVSNEVGMGIVPMNKTARIYRDILGRTNQELAAHSDRVYFMFAGIPMQIKPPIERR